MNQPDYEQTPQERQFDAFLTKAFCCLFIGVGLAAVFGTTAIVLLLCK